LPETVLVVGGAGYIGSALVARLLNSTHYNVRVLDNLLYGGESVLSFFNFRERFSFVKGDIRSMDLNPVLKDVDLVVNLAALVGEPVCKKFPTEAKEINLDANIRLATTCEQNNVQRFIFSSTCSNYGLQNSDKPVDEEGELQPISLYAETKVKSEKILLANQKKMKFSILRLATAYGLSSRIRFDLLLHEFIRDAWKKRKISLYGGESWRPLVHVDDIARAIIMCLESKSENETFNVGSNNQNFKKRELASIVARRFNCEIEEMPTVKDPRSYKVSFDRIHTKLGFDTIFNPETATDHIANALEAGLITDKILFESVNVKAE
jgi:nucleoside-diphosphate-sugar epimerase